MFLSNANKETKVILEEGKNSESYGKFSAKLT